MSKHVLAIAIMFLALTGCGAVPDPTQVDTTMSPVAMEKNIVGRDPFCDEWMGCPHPIAVACPAFVMPVCKFADNPTAINYFYNTFTTYGRVCSNPADGSVIDYVEQDGPLRRVRLYYHKGSVILFFVHEKTEPNPVCSKGNGSLNVYGELPPWCCV